MFSLNSLICLNFIALNLYSASSLELNTLSYHSASIYTFHPVHGYEKSLVVSIAICF